MGPRNLQSFSIIGIKFLSTLDQALPNSGKSSGEFTPLPTDIGQILNFEFLSISNQSDILL